ncbi:MAG: DUF1501 domain-containing protein [Alphaproteobacteria bacterium]
MSAPAALTRRRMLAGLASGATALALPRRPLAQAADDRVLILVKLAGGNDGLNTLVPYADPAYRRARPQIGLTAADVLDLGDGLGLHPGLAGLEDAWAAGDLAVVRGVGYAPADRSHFRSMDVWETGGTPAAPLPTGWLARTLPAALGPRRPLDLLVIGADPMVNVAGGNVTAYALSAGATLPRSVPAANVASAAPANPALGHILEVQRRLAAAQSGLAEALSTLPTLATPFPDDDFGRRLALAARLVAGGAPVRAILVPLAGFDTHAGQRAVHDALLSALGNGLAALRAALVEAGRWRATTVATYSEFGRRLAENGSGGTDHGTAAPHLVLGGAVAGGWHGVQPSLADLVDRDPLPTTDFRAYLASLAVAGLGLAPADATEALGAAPLALRTPA